MENISDLLAILQLSSETAPNVESVLTRYLAVSNADKTSSRLPTAEKIFPLVFGEDATIQSEADFPERRDTTWSINCQLTPGIIVTPSTPQDVGKVLALCQFLDIKFSVRSGGHLHNPGFTSNDGGVVIFMKKFNAVTVSEDRSTADIGVGQTWFNVYKALEEHGLTVTGGRQPSVGVAGLLLGGGLAFQNSERGLSCNGVVEYEVVLSDSTVAKVNATNNKDLFWALKGGGPNFGIVTKVTMTTISNRVWCEGRVFAPTENAKLFKAVIDYHNASEKDPKANLIFNSVKEATLLVFIYADPVEEKPAVFDAFDAIDCVTQMVPPNIYTIFQIVNGFESVTASEPKNHDMRTMTSLPDLDVYNAVDEYRLQQLEAVKNIPGARITMNIQPISSNAITVCDANGGNALGLKAQAHQWFLIMMDWSNPEDEAAMLEASRKIVDQAEAVAKKNGTYIDFKYSNYCSRDQDPLATYGSENLSKLRSVAREVDPRGIFQTLQNDGWLLSKTA